MLVARMLRASGSPHVTRYSTCDALSYPQARSIFLDCAQAREGMPRRRAGRPKTTPTLTSTAEMLSNSGFPARISCRSANWLLVQQRAKRVFAVA
jgi:hypothetical protein